MTLTLSFHGAAECVTGSCARLRGEEFDVLIDCGLFQGPKTLKELNYDPFPFDPAKIDAVLLTHAHIDHSGLLPKLMKAGFRGPIYATAPARELCRVMLADAGGIQESEVAQLNRRNAQRGKPEVQPIYTERDGRKVMDQFEKVKLDEWVEVAAGLSARFWAAGHMLGAASIEVKVATGGDRPLTLLFSGDLGTGEHEYLPQPTGPTGVDHLIIESTYGDRERARLDTAGRRRLLAEELNAAHEAGGPALLPAFAVGRSQELIMDILALMEEGQIPRGEIFLDSPLAIEATDVFLDRGWNRDLEANPFEALRDPPNLWMVNSPQESDRLAQLRDWHIILGGSGMCDAGRIRKHLKRLLSRPQTTLLITGYQAVGALGRLLVDGRKTVKIQGEDVRVRARVRSMEVYSGHADARTLVEWALARRPVAGTVFLNHGEPEALAGLSRRLIEAGFEPGALKIPVLDETYALDGAAAVVPADTAPRLAPGQASSLDWHNARAELLLRLDEALDSASDAQRARLLGRLEALLPERQ